MFKARIFLILGIWLAILPYLGFPYSWKDVLVTISGLVVVYFSYLLYRDNKIKMEAEKTFDNFKENSDFDENINAVETTMGEEEKI